MQTHNATYFFNIGANVIPVASGPSGVCLNNNAAAAYQVIPPGGQYSGCYELTADFSVRNLYTRALFDAANPARGWQIRASGGSSQYCGSARSFTWIFMCDKTNPAPPLQSNNYTFVEEIAGCQYAAFMYSQAGCPLGAYAGGAAAAAAAASRRRRCWPLLLLLHLPRMLLRVSPLYPAARRPSALTRKQRRVPAHGQGRLQQPGRVRVRLDGADGALLLQQRLQCGRLLRHYVGALGRRHLWRARRRLGNWRAGHPRLLVLCLPRQGPCRGACVSLCARALLACCSAARATRCRHRRPLSPDR